MCSDSEKLKDLPPANRKWKILLRSTAAFFAVFAAAEIICGVLLQIYCFIPLDLLNIFGSIMLWLYSKAWRIYFIVMAMLYAMLDWFIYDMLVMLQEEAGFLLLAVPAVMLLHIAAGVILLIYPGGSRSDTAGK